MENKIIAINETIHQIVREEIARLGNQADLNHIDVSQVTKMDHLFFSSCFNGDISRWDVSNVKTMRSMFSQSPFNGDISQWDTSNVRYMDFIFQNCHFDGDVSRWNLAPNCVPYRAMTACPAAQSEHFGALHFACKASDSNFPLHPKAQAIWDAFLPMAHVRGVDGPGTDKVIWPLYRASLNQQQVMTSSNK